MLVQSHLQIITPTVDRMQMMCFVCNPTKPHSIAAADRSETGWVVSAKGTKSVEVGTRAEAIDVMINDVAPTVLPDDAYSCSYPHGLRELP